MDVNVNKGNAMRVRAVFPWMVACSLVVCSVQAFGDDCATGSVAQQIACLRMNNAVLSERLTQATLRKNLNKETSSGGVNTRKLGLPLVMSTYGIGKMTAVLVYMHHEKSDGTLIVHSGSRLPGGWTVRAIVGGTVAIEKHNQTKTLLLNAGSSGHSMSLSTSADSNAGFNLSPMGGPPPITSSSGAVSGMAGVR